MLSLSEPVPNKSKSLNDSNVLFRTSVHTLVLLAGFAADFDDTTVFILFSSEVAVSCVQEVSFALYLVATGRSVLDCSVSGISSALYLAATGSGMLDCSVQEVSSASYLLATGCGVLDCSVSGVSSFLFLLATGCGVLDCSVSGVFSVLYLLVTGCNVLDCGIPVILSVLYLHDLATGSGVLDCSSERPPASRRVFLSMPSDSRSQIFSRLVK